MIGRVNVRNAVELLAADGFGTLGATTWVDLGCGEGTFTLALAERLAAESTIHAIDRDQRALTKIPTHHRRVRILTHRGDFTAQPWPFADLDGVLMANSLHYVSH
jgi:trans-aconitate methyltransferase